MGKLHISVIGSGVIGTATGRGFLEHGCEVEFIDVQEGRVQDLRDEGLDAFTAIEARDREFKSQLSMLTVSTPTEDGRINLDYLKAAAVDLGKRLSGYAGYHVVVVRSTVSPGTTEDIVAPLIEEHSGKQRGVDFGLCMNPEYLREVSAEEDFKNPWIITIGELDKRSGDMLAEAYQGYSCPVYRIGIKEAEYQKYVHNLFNAVKIGFFNEMRDVAEQTGIDAQQAFAIVVKSAEAMWNPAYGTKDLGPFDGMCLPKDTQAFLAWGKAQGISMPILRCVIEENADRLKKERGVALRHPELAGVLA